MQENVDPGISVETNSKGMKRKKPVQTLRNVDIRFEDFEWFNQELLKLVKRLKKKMQLNLDNISSLTRGDSTKGKSETKKDWQGSKQN